MKIKRIDVKNFRLLKNVSISIDPISTLIVGRNNSGKTSLTEIFRSFLSGSKPSLQYEDFNILSLNHFKDAYDALCSSKDEDEIRQILPTIELRLRVCYQSDSASYGILSEFILDLDADQFETDIQVVYRLADGKLKALFEGISDTTTEGLFYKIIKQNVLKFYEIKVFAIDPTDYQNIIDIEYSNLRRLLNVDYINAQRGLDDETHNEKDVLGKALGNIFRSSSLLNAPDEFKALSNDINLVVEQLQGKIDIDFQTKVNQLLPSLSMFGYPGLHDPKLSAATQLNAKSILESNTRVHYQKNSHFTLPETYNGLGSRNLIYILFQIYEFFRNYQSAELTPKGHLIFIEEPEAHLHPQMQEVFIRQLKQIVSTFERDFNAGNEWPVQFVVSTHSTHIANEADFETVRYFLSKQENEVVIKDLGVVFFGDSDTNDKEFLHKYLTLTKCDLYFADKAIMIEGATERIILPEILKKIDELKATNLRSQYLSIVEIGGAYAHHFYKFLDFLELKTLIITDLDCVVQKKNSDGETTYPSCPYSEASHSSNIGLSKWFGGSGYLKFEDIVKKTNSDKISGHRRISYEIPENDRSACGRSFEDAFILANRNLFEFDTLTNEVDVEKKAFDFAKKISNKSKANFAIEYAIDKTNWITPKYIEEGLVWLSSETLTSNSQDGQ